MIAAGIGLDHTGINGEAFTLDQASIHAGSHHSLEQLPEDIAAPEPTVAIDRERRMVRHPVVKIEPAEPPICEVHLDLLAQPPLGANAVAIANNQHPDH